MNTKSLEECKQILQKGDNDTLERRAQRLQELAQIQINGRLFSSQREWDYSGEASNNFIDGNYRSAIFCCACAVDQIFRYEYLKVPGNRYEDLERCTFGQTIRKCENKGVESLLPYMEKAELLNTMRNKVATHPLFIDLPAQSDPERQLRDELLLKDIRKLLDLIGRIDANLKREIESTKLISEVEGKTYLFGRVVNRQSEVPTAMDGFWGLIEDQILKFLANQAWNIMKTISEGLYGVNQRLYS